MRDDTCSTQHVRTTNRLRRWLSYTMLAFACLIFGWQAHVMRVKYAAEQDKRIRSGFWEQAVHDTSTAIVAVEADSELIVDWNKGSEKMLGWQAHDVIGSKYAFLLPEDVRETHTHLMTDKAIRQELLTKVATINCWVYNKWGRPRAVQVRVRGMAADEHYYYIVTFDEQRNVMKLPDSRKPPPANEVEPKRELKEEKVKELLPKLKD